MKQFGDECMEDNIGLSKISIEMGFVEDVP